MLRIVVVGQSLRGLIAAWVFRQHPAVEVLVVGAHALAVHNAIDELSPNSPSLRSLFNAIGVAHSAFRPRVATMRGGRLRKCGKLGEARLRFDAEDLSLCLRGGSRPLPTAGWSIEPGEVLIGNLRVSYDFLLLALPMALCRQRVWFPVPADPAPTLYQSLVSTPFSPYHLWEEVLTRETPAGVVTRILNHIGSCIVESKANGAALQKDLTYLFPRGFQVECTQKHHRWVTDTLPENLASVPEAMPLGATIDFSYDLLRHWTTQRRKTT